jgi:hypothetical protein
MARDKAVKLYRLPVHLALKVMGMTYVSRAKGLNMLAPGLKSKKRRKNE